MQPPQPTQPPGPQSPYQYQVQPPGPYAPYPYGQPPTAPGPPPRPNRVVLAVVVVVVVAVIVLAVFFAVILPGIQSSAAQPSITVSNPTYSAPGCGLFASSQAVTFHFTLVNTGNAAGVAVMAFYMDQSTSLGSQQYTILAGSSQPLTASFTVNDCLTHTYQYALTSVTKA